jgi:peptidoglycan hydrolase CwlO-like protein
MIIDTNANPSLATIPAEVSNLANSNIDLVIEESVLCIDSRAVFFDGSELLKSIKTRQKTLEAHRVEVTKPLRGVIDTINGWFKSVTEPLETAEASLKRKLAVFEKAEMERQQAEQARLDAIARREREELEARAEKAADKGNLEQAQALARRSAEVVAARADVAPVKNRPSDTQEPPVIRVVVPPEA